jgi:hypothetical protein
VKLLPAAVLCTAALAAAGCGGDDAEGEQPSSAGSDESASLRVVIRAEGKGSSARRVEVECDQLGPESTDPTCRRLGGLTKADLAPVPADMACAEIYGGPAVATVTGTLRGEPVKARFALTDGCQIERWRRNRELLGNAPDELPPSP